MRGSEKEEAVIEIVEAKERMLRNGKGSPAGRQAGRVSFSHHSKARQAAGREFHVQACSH